jgi:hypothetical protein
MARRNLISEKSSSLAACPVCVIVYAHPFFQA